MNLKNDIFGGEFGFVQTLKTKIQLLKDAGAVLILMANRADGSAPGKNSPFTNPLIDLTKLSNNATLTNFAATQTDGYTLEATVNSNGQAVGYDNLVVNPTFVDTSGWVGESSSLSVNSNKLIITGSGVGANVRARQDLGIKPANGKKLNIKARFRVTTTGASNLQLFLRDGVAGTFLDTKQVNSPVQNQWYEAEFSIVATMPTLVNNLHLFVSHNYPDSATANGKIAELEKPQVIYITDNPQITSFETNQLSKPLDAAACDRIFPFVATTGVTYVSARPYIATEGLDSLGVLANNPSVDITGLEEFAISWCGLTPTNAISGDIFNKCLDGATANTQLSVTILNDNSVVTKVGGNSYTTAPVGTVKQNAQTQIDVERKGGRLKCWVNDVLTYDQPNTVSLVSQPNFRLFARSSNASGTTHNIYFKGLTAYLILARGTYGDLSKLDDVLDKVARDYR